MSSSPLEPRKNSQRVARTRSSPRTPAPPQAGRHFRLWDAIRLTRDELSDWQRRSELTDTLFRQHILPRETRLTTIHSELTERLMDQYEEASLGAAEQALLSLWIADNLETLATHPFADEQRCAALKLRWLQILHTRSERDADKDKTRPSSGSLLDDLFDDELDDDDEVFDFGWHGGSSSRRNESVSDAKAHSASSDNDPDTDTDDAADRKASGKARPDARNDSSMDEGNDRISQLEKSLSVERLFRQLARALHPDRELDETRKAEKHELMSQCLIARQNKDINTLLTLYYEHIGELPDELSGRDHEELIEALERQLQQLQRQLRQARFGNPLMAQIIERYSTGTDAQTRQRIRQHADTLDIELTRQSSVLQNLESDDGLLNELAERREIEQDRLIIDGMTGYSAGR